MNIFIEIHSQDPKLSFEMMEGPRKMDIKADLPGNAVIMKVHPSIEGKEMFLLSFGAKVPPGSLANWLYKKIKGRATKLLMDRIEVPIDKGEIKRVITEKIEKESKLQRT